MSRNFLNALKMAKAEQFDLPGDFQTMPGVERRRAIPQPHADKDWEPGTFRNLFATFTAKRKGEIRNWLARVEDRYGSLTCVLCQSYQEKVAKYFQDPWPSQKRMLEGRGIGDFKASLVLPFLMVWRWINYEKLWEGRGGRTKTDRAIEELKFGPREITLYEYLIGKKIYSIRQILELEKNSEELVAVFYWRHFFKGTQHLLERAGYKYQPELTGVRFPEDDPQPVYHGALSKR